MQLSGAQISPRPAWNEQTSPSSQVCPSPHPQASSPGVQVSTKGAQTPFSHTSGSPFAAGSQVLFA